MTFIQNFESPIPSTWVLLDSQSTVSVFRSAELLSNIQRSASTLTVLTNGGPQLSEWEGTSQLFGKIWYNPTSLANILSLALVRRLYRVSMDTDVDSTINVHLPAGRIMRFQEFKTGLYYFDAASFFKHNHSNSTVNPYPPIAHHTFVETVAANKTLFTPREISNADRARRLYRHLGRPSEAQFQQILKQNFLHDCPVTPDDAKRALVIYGPDIATLKGKTTHQTQPHVPTYTRVTIPAPILSHHKHVTLCVDFMFINGNPFLHTISRDLCFRTIASVTSRSANTIIRELRAVLRFYASRNLEVVSVSGDQEFECAKDDLHPIFLDIADTDSHVPEIERSIRTVKERVRSTLHGMPFKRVPRIMIRALAEFAVQSLNQLPAQNGVSPTLSPHTIMTGQPPRSYKHYTLDFGTYAQVYEDNDPSNSTKSRTTGAIALNHSGNSSGGYHFMSLVTGLRLARRQWTVVPMPEWVPNYVEDMASAEKQQLLINNEPLWEWRPGVPIEPDPDTADDEFPLAPLADPVRPLPPHPLVPDPAPDVAPAAVVMPPPPSPPQPIVSDQEFSDDFSDNDSDLSFDDSSVASSSSSSTSSSTSSPLDTVVARRSDEPVFAFVDTADSSNIDTATVLDTDDDDPTLPDPRSAPADAPTIEEPRSAPSDAPNIEELRSAPNDAPTIVEPRSAPSDNPGNQTSTITASTTSLLRRSNRATTRSNQNVRFAESMAKAGNSKTYTNHQLLQQQVTNDTKDTNTFVTGFIMTQMTARAGIKKHGQLALDALYREFQQLHDKSVFEGIDATTLTREQRKLALRAINLIKEKRSGKIKGRTCANGRPQRKLYTKEETASPTVATDSLLLSLVIDAKEGRDVAVADVEGAYLHADMDDYTLLKLTGVDVDIMCKVNESYVKFVTTENNKRVLYLRLVKALYGCVKSAVLWYELFASTLTKMGFVLNPYDPCVANKLIEGSQCTIVWYVDDNKISHVNPKVVTSIIEGIESRFGKMTVTRGNEHEFLGMDIVFNNDETVTIGMDRYVKEAIADFGEKITRKAATPATKTLFDVSPDAELLEVEKQELFHSIVVKLLYVSKRARVDIQLAIAFLCTRVSCSTIEDWKKLRRVLQYLSGTMNDTLTLGADDLTKVITWTDASYAVHKDMKSHTGGVVSLGRGAVMSKSSKQKLNTKSSTEAEIVGASDYLPSTIWAQYFLDKQGYDLDTSIFYQDNQSAMKLAINGRKSAGQKSRHINIRYFFIKDRLKTDNIRIEYCPTEEMLADFFTKPLQGSLFRKLREVIMGRKHIKSLKAAASTTTKERVGDNMIGSITSDKVLAVDDGTEIQTSVTDIKIVPEEYVRAGKTRTHNKCKTNVELD